MKLHRLLTLAILFLSATLQAADPDTVDLAKIDRRIVKEPKYANTPCYALVVFGLQAQHRAWLVMDGSEVLYVDRNGNGELTDPEDRIECDEKTPRADNPRRESALSGMNTFEIGTVAGVKLRFHFWVRKKNFVSSDDFTQKLYQEREANKWQNGTLWRLSEQGGQAQNPILLTATPAEAQISHLDGPLTFALKWNERQRLQPWPKTTTFDIHIGTPALPARNYTRQIFSPLTEQEIPRDIHPVAVFEYPPVKPGSKPIIQTVELDLRCCGDTAYARMSLPKEIGSGNAKVTLSYSAWKIRDVQPVTFEVPIGGDTGSNHEETSYVMFDDAEGNIGLNDIMTALRAKGLKVQKITQPELPELLQIQVRGEPAIAITVNRDAKVLEVARALGAGTPFEKALNRSQSRFEILVFPASLIVQEKELLSRIHAVIQSETQGIVYTTWDQQFLKP